MKIEDILNHSRIFESRIIDFDKITFSPEVVSACRVNYCGQFGTCWTCPPGIGSLDEIKSRLSAYKSAFVFTCLHSLKDSFDVDGMDSARRSTMAALCEICAELDSRGIVYSALGCSSCDVCAKCTYPGAPCRFPEKAVPAVEACGIDVVKLAQDIGIGYNNGKNTVTYFCIILY